MRGCETYDARSRYGMVLKMTVSWLGIPNAARALVFFRIVFACVLAVPAFPDARAAELDSGSSQIDVQAFREYTGAFTDVIGDLDRLVGSYEEAKEAEVSADRAARHRETIAITKMLADGRRQFERLYREQAEDMAEEVERARKDAEVRRVAAVFGLVANLLQLGAEFYRQSPPAPSEEDTSPRAAPELPGGEPKPDALEGSVLVERKAQQKLWIFTDGEWKAVDIKQMISTEIRQPPGGGEGSAPDPVGDTDLLADRFGAWAGELPPIVCDDTFRGCFPMAPDSTVDSGDGPSPIEVRLDAIAPVAPPQRPPTEAEAALFKSIKTISSMALDLTPFLGTAKSGVEVITGRDPVTGLRLSRAAAAVGFVASAFPGGKLWVKVGGKGALKYGKKVFRHYTSRSGSNAILKTGVIKANPKKIYAESADGRNKNPLSKADAEERYRIRTGKGRDYVEFRVPEGTKVKTETGLGGFDEVVIEGDVFLGPDAKVVQRR